MGGGVGFDDADKAGDEDVDRCRSGFVGCVGIGALELLAVAFSFTFLFDALDFATSSDGAGTAPEF